MPWLMDAVMALNVLWFGAGALNFGVTTSSAIKRLVARSARQAPLYPVVFAAVRFLGGLNLGFAVLAGVLLLDRALFPEAAQAAALTSVIALAHGTQFATNVSVAVSRGSQDESRWPILRGLMLFIFLVDFALMLVNGALAALLFTM